jgi:UDP-glucose 4-epimerase
MKILITGGAGFIGKNLYEQFHMKYIVKTRNSTQLDLLDFNSVYDHIKKNKYDIIIHTATYDAAPKTSVKDPQKVLEKNLRMFFNLARCNDYYDRLIYFGSGAEFSRENWQPGMNEAYFDKYVPSDQYGYSKYIMTKYSQSNSFIYNLRLFGVFGKYEDWRYRFISNAISRVMLDQPIEIKQNVYFDYLYIDDLVKIVDWFLNNKPKHNVYNVCSGQAVDLKTLAEKVLSISGKNLDIIIKKKGLGREYSGDNTLIMKELSGLRLSSMEDSIRDLYNWYFLNKEILK